MLFIWSLVSLTTVSNCFRYVDFVNGDEASRSDEIAHDPDQFQTILINDAVFMGCDILAEIDAGGVVN